LKQDTMRKNTNRRGPSVVLLVVLLTMIALPFLLPLIPFAEDALGKGTDDGARRATEEIAPTFEPWMESLWAPSDSDAERFLFSVQATLGAVGLYWAIHALRRRAEVVS